VVARKQRRKRDRAPTEDEAVRALLASVPAVNEDPTVFRGTDLWEVKRQIEAEPAESRWRFHSDAEFEDFLDQLSKGATPTHR